MFDTIVWATDGSEVADAALPLVTELALARGSTVIAVHVDERFRGGRLAGGPLLADEGDLRAKIADQVEDLLRSGIAAALEVKTTDRLNTAELIAEAADKVEADLIVVGTHARGAATSAVIGSVPKALIHMAHCPVLAVPVVREAVTIFEHERLAVV